MALKPQITWIGSPNFGYPAGTAGRDGHKPIAIVMHLMDGTLAGTDSWFQHPDAAASSHFGVGKDGTIHQYVKVEDAAWANGLVQSPTWPLLQDGVNPNLYTVSIEHEGAHEHDPNGAISVFWEPTEAQYQATLALTRWLVEELGIPVDEDHLIGHYRIDGVTRANCPGPGFPWKRLLSDLAPAPVVEAAPAVQAPLWDPAAEIARLKERGIIKNDHTPCEPLTWGTFATIINRVLDEKGV